MFRRNVLAPSSGLKGSSRKQQAMKITSCSPTFLFQIKIIMPRSWTLYVYLLDYRQAASLKLGNFRGSQTLSYCDPPNLYYIYAPPPPVSPSQRSTIPHILEGLHQTLG
jgi:hypothetical protein